MDPVVAALHTVQGLLLALIGMLVLIAVLLGMGVRYLFQSWTILTQEASRPRHGPFGPIR